ncbi:MAG: RDD family protein [gamma proteobacterium endosymbiont of Lamellibrachia anaximandri]|nr:RDD family protein [gamma proteobacterium endosymbiont of Lamellibrachia anaximandri]MBL3534664.1 RDD family protein [gamma proteobacterium endosymbiont of Lamellibrachia anaximandri]MBL3601380.1 RDD family protein [gamma proteobacterium endosymbiont of Lamellibrachia anaximandri]
MVTTEEVDTTRQYEIPEGVLLEFRLAGPLVRAGAWAIDAAIRAVLYIAIGLSFSYFGGVGVAIILIALFLIEWFYPVLFEVKSGATPGKKAMGIWVIHDNGTPVTLSASVIRNLLRAVDFMPVMYGFGLLSMLFNREFKRLGDLAAGTLVVYRDSYEKRPELPSSTAVRPGVELTESEQQAVLAFAERAPALSSERRVELAEILSEISGRKGERAVDGIYGYANWLMKGR